MKLRFCSSSPDYPIEKKALYSRLLKESTTFPLKNGLSYFQSYIQNGGERIHPILGDLFDFVKDVESAWSTDNYGENLIIGFLKSQLDLGTNNNMTP